MLVVGGKNPVGHVIHLIVGPESEFYMDVHGAKVLDITGLLVAMQGSERIFLSFTRCRSELQTSQIMTAATIPFLTSFNGKPVCDKPDNPVVMGVAPELPGATVPAPAQATKPAGPVVLIGRCSYCGKATVELLPIAQFKICAECAQIELGRNRSQGESHVADVAEDQSGASS